MFGSRPPLEVHVVLHKSLRTSVILRRESLTSDQSSQGGAGVAEAGTDVTEAGTDAVVDEDVPLRRRVSVQWPG